MSKRPKTATLSKGRTSWCVIFRHPVCKTTDGRQQLRIRRGLGTSDKDEAETLIAQLNAILMDPTYWNLGERKRADHKFDSKIVAAFYDHMEPPNRNPWDDRRKIIDLPGGKGATDGYARVQLIGTTGAGKTTVLRQLIGTDPSTERFPSISAAKTTICDIEIILDEGHYRAVVSFIDRDLVRQYIADCVAAAVASELEHRSEREVVRRFLEHSEQRFRLNYLLGNMESKLADHELSDDDGEQDDELFAAEADLPTDEERERLENVLRGYLDSIRQLAKCSRAELTRVADSLGIELDKATQPERSTLQEIIEDDLTSREDFHELVDAILDDVESRFELLEDGELEYHRDGWPQIWKLESDDRPSFIRTVNRFSSNYAQSFGRLLTPLVQGIRVAGPFTPDWMTDASPRLVLLDGQGLGHTADSTSSISTSITSRYQLVDAILLVDNAAQPMQAAPCSALESVVSSGHESKLIIGFTHFDEVVGDNLGTTSAKMDHVLGSLDNAIGAISKSQGRDAANALRQIIPDRVVFLSKIQKKLPSKSQLTLTQFDKLLEAIAKSILPKEPIHYVPVYDVANLVLSIQAATQEFHDRWHGILSMGSRSGIAPEHWTRVKALTRRFGVFREDEYDNLRPVADMIRLLQNHLSRFLASPLGWDPTTPPEDDDSRTRAIDSIRTEVFTRLHDLSKRRILDERFSGWLEAFEHRGTGSTRLRARDVVHIYESAAPIPNEMPGPDANEFLFEIRELVLESVQEGGGKLKGWTREDIRIE